VKRYNNCTSPCVHASLISFFIHQKSEVLGGYGKSKVVLLIFFVSML
ncbi:MAG: hypothetical protein ACI90V_007087, partial [Bacillariaceae sp.]